MFKYSISIKTQKLYLTLPEQSIFNMDCNLLFDTIWDGSILVIMNNTLKEDEKYEYALPIPYFHNGNMHFIYTWVHALWIEFNSCPTRCDLFSLLHFCRQLYMFQVLTPIIRSSYSCNYSFWYWLTGSTTIHSRCWVGTATLSSNSTTRADGSRSS